MTTALYKKSAGISLLLHALLLLILSIFIQPILLPAPSNATPIEVEFIASSVTDKRSTFPTEISSPTVVQNQMPQPHTPISTKQPLMQHGEVLQQSTTTEAPIFASSFSGTTTPDIPNVTNTTNISNTNTKHDALPKANEVEKSTIRTQASYRSGSRPAYPSAARQAGWEGSVIIRTLVTTDGSVATASVHQSSGYPVLDDAAKQAVKSWSFTPARQGTHPIESYFDVRVTFSLADL